MANRAPFAPEEWYHCYNRGVDKRKVFEYAEDYTRFLLLLYVGNGSKSIHISNLKDKRLASVLEDASLDRGDPLVDIGAYCLMPNHIHLVLKEVRPGGIALFMQKVFTGYTMYFNKKYERNGPLFAGAFKSKHIADDRYIKRALSYVHLNPAGLTDKKWKEKAADIAKVEKQIRNYSYSSAPDFESAARPQKKILGKAVFELFDTVPTIREMIEDAYLYSLYSDDEGGAVNGAGAR